MIPHIVKSTWVEEMKFDADISNHHVILDDGEKAIGPSPKRLMLAALGACTGMDVVSILNKMKVKFTQFSVEVEANVKEQYPKIYESVLITYSIKIEDKDKAKMEKAIKLSQDKYCSVSAMFKAFATLDTRIEYL
jgi:putative redox protein